MKEKELTTEKVMTEIYYQNNSAYLESDSFTSSDNELNENDEVFNLAVAIADQELEGFEFIEIESHGKGSRAIWHSN